MWPRKIFRLGGCVAALGFMTVLASLAAAGVALLGFLFTGAATVGSAQSLDEVMCQNLVDHGVPAPIASRVISGPPLTQKEREALTQDQRRRVEVMEQNRLQTRAATGVFALLGGGTSICLGSAGFIGLVLGFLLMLRKRVLQCGNCGAVVAAG